VPGYCTLNYDREEAMAEPSIKEQVGEIVSEGKRRVGMERPTAADEDGRIGIVRGALRTFGEGDSDGFLDALREDVTWAAPANGNFPGGGEHSGCDAVREEYVENIGRTYTSFGFRPETFVDADDADAVIVIGRFEADGVEGDRVDEPGVQVWEFKGNAVSRVRIFTDSAGFPEVVTERKEKEWEEEDRQKEESSKDGSEDSDQREESSAEKSKSSEDSEDREDGRETEGSDA